MKILLIAFAILFIAATLLPLLRHEVWWIRIFDFPRGQIAAGGIVLLAAYLYLWDARSLGEGVVLGVLTLCVGYQGIRMLPYTPMAPKEVLAAAQPQPGATFTLLVANVLMTNRNAGGLLELVREHDPDVILAVEVDPWWQAQLRPLEAAYPHTIEQPLDNTYGMIVYSRLELLGPEVRYIIQDDIPSMHARVRLPSGDLLRLHCVHPEPPYPREAKRTTERDAELLVLAKEIRAQDGPTVLAGDLNDVAWSHTTHLFQEISGLLDPRKGRGLYSTFGARNPFLRWPLDHVFHSDHFKLIRLERLDRFGSDHFPVLVSLSLEPGAVQEQEGPEADRSDEREASRKIRKARRIPEPEH